MAALFQSQGGRIFHRLRDSVIILLIRYIGTEAAIEDFQLRLFVEFLDKTLFVFFPLFFNQLDGFVRRNRQWVEFFRDGNKLAIVPDERTETTDRELTTVMSNSFGFGGTNATLVMRKLKD